MCDKHCEVAISIHYVPEVSTAILSMVSIFGLDNINFVPERVVLSVLIQNVYQ